MPKDSSIESVLVIVIGPIVIGQACEFDYSGTQACRVLRSEGIRVILINSNPATIMTDPEFADATYIEPITPEIIEQIIVKEKPTAILATLGGQTALNAAMQLYERGSLERLGVKLLDDFFYLEIELPAWIGESQFQTRIRKRLAWKSRGDYVCVSQKVLEIDLVDIPLNIASMVRSVSFLAGRLNL